MILVVLAMQDNRHEERKKQEKGVSGASIQPLNTQDH